MDGCSRKNGGNRKQEGLAPNTSKQTILETDGKEQQQGDRQKTGQDSIEQLRRLRKNEGGEFKANLGNFTGTL